MCFRRMPMGRLAPTHHPWPCPNGACSASNGHQVWGWMQFREGGVGGGKRGHKTELLFGLVRAKENWVHWASGRDQTWQISLQRLTYAYARAASGYSAAVRNRPKMVQEGLQTAPKGQGKPLQLLRDFIWCVVLFCTPLLWYFCFFLPCLLATWLSK